MERKTGVSVRATESQTQEKMDHSCTAHKYLLLLPASHKSHTALPASKGVWEKRLLFAKKDKVFFRTRKSNKKDWLGKWLLT